jgi:hypothetical protein
MSCGGDPGVKNSDAVGVVAPQGWICTHIVSADGKHNLQPALLMPVPQAHVCMHASQGPHDHAGSIGQ